jgi:hypothetical protein
MHKDLKVVESCLPLYRLRLERYTLGEPALARF